MKKTIEPIPEQILDTIVASIKEPEYPFTPSNAAQNALWHCMVFISKGLGLVLKKPPLVQNDYSVEEEVQIICDSNNMQTRTIELTGQWWKRDIGPVLAFYESFDNPAAIIPKSFNRYVLVVPSKKIKCLLTPALAVRLLSQGLMFYRTLPETKLHWYDIAKFVLNNLRTDFLRILIAQIFIALLGFISPIAMGIIFSNIIPSAAYDLLWQTISILTVNVVIIALFTTILMISALRVRIKMVASLQAAIWDRLIRLPIYFFRNYTAGDLANRANGIDRIEQIMTNSVFISISSGTLSLVSLALMFYYSVELSIGASVSLILIVTTVLIVNARQLIYLRKNLFLQGKLTGMVLQFIVSISKIKITHSEVRVFQQWADIFSEKNHMLYRSGRLIIVMTLCNAAFAVLTTILLFTLMMLFGKNLSFGDFISFNALYAQFFAAILAMVAVVTSIMSIFPLYHRLKPILEHIPEPRYESICIEKVTGKIDLVNLSFRYNKETPMVYKNLTLSILPGQIVCFIGSSGCGKSTLFRLLLGLEKPNMGKIYYSNMDLDNISMRSIRQQTGVVLQDSVLFPGTILENIVGHSKLYHLDEVLQLIEHVGFTEELKKMPMGLHTLLTEQGKTLSNGQRQRLLLAQALYKRPNLLFLDEATSSLDNVTQEKIYRHLASLDLTCLVISHRASTLRFADVIYVIEDGGIACKGTFKELLKKSKLFKQLLNKN